MTYQKTLLAELAVGQALVCTNNGELW